MKKPAWKTYALWIIGAELTGALSGWLSRGGMELYQTSLRQPPLSPPGIVFPVVWTVLFALMGIGAARIALTAPSRERTRALRLYFLQLGFNFFWSILFFDLRRFGLALLWLLALWVLILRMIQAFRAVDPLAWKLQIPYLLWVTFAAYLNFGVWRLN